MRRWMIVAVALVALALLSWWARGSAPVAPPPGEPVAVTGDSSNEEHLLLSNVHRAGDESRRSVPGQPAEEDAHEGDQRFEAVGSFALRGVCVRAEDGIGLADCRILVEIGHDIAAETRSDRDGAFEVTVPFDASRSAHIAFQAEGRVHRRSELWQIVDATVEDLGTIPFQRGFFVRGRVVDSSGEPVAGLLLRVDGYDDRVPVGVTSFGTSSAFTAADGSFELEPAIPAGAHRVQIWEQPPDREPNGAEGFRGGGRFAFDESTGPPELELVLESLPTILGRVESPDGAPCEGVAVRTGDGLARAVTSFDGTFRLDGERPVDSATTVLLDDATLWPDASPVAATWGGEPAVLRLPPTPPIRVRVRDDRGEPVTRFSWVLIPQHGRESPSPIETHPNGELAAPALRRGPQLLRIVPESRELLPSEPIALSVAKQPLPVVEITLQRLAAVTVEVVDATGTAVPGAAVRLWRVVAGVPPDAEPTDPRSTGSVEAVRRNELVANQIAGPEGRARLFAPSGVGGLMLRVQHDDYLDAVVDASRIAATGGQRVTLHRGGTIHGRVALNGEARDEHEVLIVRAEADGEHLVSSLELDGASEFRSAPLPAGHYAVRVGRGMVNSSPGASSTTFVAARHAGRVIEARVDVTEGREVPVALDVPRPVFGSLRGRIAVIGAPRPIEAVCLTWAEGESGARGQFAVDADGRFFAEQLVPGRYHVALRYHNKEWPLPPAVTIRPGEVSTGDFVHTWRRVTVDVVDTAGAPYFGGIWLRCGGARSWHRCRGSLLLEPAPGLPIELQRRDGGPWTPPIPLDSDRVRAVLR